ncbi:Neurogenic locus notch-like protein 1 [Holothuria leucospilota]|uniref:protein-tyrosine-phosphatase n=1 Tax=Holothuria leucospilota TaxID=206669 RepID=A0A9Q1C8F3_HOLLE|nr:Neurogenic locus notch-like protein 1 [Holothuria leucospilota]
MSTPALPTMHGVKDHLTESIVLLILCCSLVQTVEIQFEGSTDVTITEGNTLTRNVCHDSSVPTSNAIFFLVSASPITSALTLPTDPFIPAGSGTCITVTIRSMGNFVREDTRTFQISLSSTFADVDENQGHFFINVLDNDSAPRGTDSCPTPTVIPGSEASCSDSSSTGSVCSYDCLSGFERLSGDTSRTCSNSLRWSGSPLFCISAFSTCVSGGTCQNGGDCMSLPLGGFKCSCRPGWTGLFCTQPTCSPNPCGTRGSCSIQGGTGFSCDCFGGWTGTTCTQPNCLPNVCSNGGTCLLPRFGDSVCNCPPGWTGLYCTQPTCSPDPCGTRGFCSIQQGTGFSCDCFGGWTGTTCTRPTCSLNVCSNGGTCLLPRIGDSVCNCPPGWTGLYCTQPTCSPDPCGTRGFCSIQQGTGFSCDCFGGWTGTTCTRPTCSLNVCSNGGTCLLPRNNGLICNCAAGWMGLYCTQPTCVPNPCQNGGLCNLQGNNNFICNCLPGWAGTTCTQSSCTPNPCTNGGTCTLEGSTSFTCKCVPGWTGKQCTQRHCISNPCKNGGSCFPLDNSFHCACAPGWTGPFCSMDVDECTSTPCLSGGSCIDNINSYMCNCQLGWSGSNCAIGCTFSNQACNEVSCHCLRDEVCNYNSGACLRSNCTILNCPAAIESVTLSKMNPSSSVNISCTLIGSTAVLEGLQLWLSREPEGLNVTGITRLTGNRMNSGLYSVQGTFRAHNVTKETNLYCVLFKVNDWIGRVSVTDFVYELPTLSAAPIPGNVSNTSVTIRWRAWDGTVDDGDPPVVAYIPYYLRSSSMEWQRGGKVSVGRPFEFQADNLEVDIQYDFSVAAVREGENGEGPRSPSVTVKTLCNAPDMPISVNTQLASSNRVNVSWQLPPGEVMCSTGVTSYRVYYRIEGSIEDTPQLAGTVEDVDTRWFIVDDGLLEPESSYVFFVTVHTDQESDFRESEPIQTPAGPGSGPLVGIIVAVISIMFLLIILLLVVFLLIKRKRDKKADDNTPAAKPVDNTYDNPVFGIPDVRRHNAEPAKAAEPVPRIQPSVREDYDSKSVESLSIEKESSPDDVIYGNLEQPKPIRVAEFGEYFRQNVDKFDHEFSILEGSKKQFDWTAAEDPANKKKNRFKSMYTYDHSRVVLWDLPDQEGSDYYNASFIKDTNDVVAYIASQAPNRASLEDFVRMIWEQHVTTIVMVANLYEDGKERCLQYWPENEGGSTSFGFVTVTWLKTTQFSDFVIRYFTFKRGKETREVQQLHFLTWPDKDTPEHGTALIEFTKQSKLLHRGKKYPMLVHCSAGIGRTGTFICLNCMMDVLRDEEYIDVFGFVNKIRQNRVNMVQTSKQYVFLYKCLNEYHLTHQTEMSVRQMTRLNVESHRGILLGEFEVIKMDQAATVFSFHNAS